MSPEASILLICYDMNCAWNDIFPDRPIDVLKYLEDKKYAEAKQLAHNAGNYANRRIGLVIGWSMAAKAADILCLAAEYLLRKSQGQDVRAQDAKLAEFYDEVAYYDKLYRAESGRGRP